VLTSHLVAFAAFEILKNKNYRLDIYGLLRLPADDYVFPWDTMRGVVGQLRDRLIDMAERDEIKLSEQMMWDIDRLIRDGVKRLGTYHLSKPLRFSKEGKIISESFKVLYFYHNRLDGYGLAENIQWKQYALQMV